MSPRSNPIRILALVAALAAPAVARADDLLEYLESRGLDTLAAQRLQDLARTATPEDRAQYLDRLADLLSRLLDATPQGAEQDRVLAEADALAESLATARGDQLRVAAARARYKAAARVAEAIRAGIPGDAQAAADTLGAQADILLATAERAEKRVTEFDRKLDREEGIGRDLLEEQVDRERSLAGQSRYLAAWCLLYRGTLTRGRGDVDRAEKLFVAMLGGRDGALAPNEVSEDLRGDEAFASAILGLSLAKARTAGFSEASRWLALLDSKDTHASVRAALPGWTMVAALDAGAFKSARGAFAKLAAREDVANWARVAAARAIEDGGTDGDAPTLVREALAQLAAARELGALRALVERYGEGILGADAAGFVPRYVRAVRLYDEAQKALAAAGEDEEKLKSEDVRGPSRAAADALEAALTAEDAASFADAAVACRLMRAWSLRGARSFIDASRVFDEVAAASVGARAEEAARLAIVSLDDARSASRSRDEVDALDRQLVTRIDAFLARFPGSNFAPDLLVRKVAASDSPDNADIDALLAVKPDSKQWLSSRKQAAYALYRLFRGGKAPRAETAKRYFAVLSELPPDSVTRLPASSAAIARQALEVALASEVRDTKLAASLLEGLQAAGARGEFDIREADEELAYRSLQLAIYSNRWADVETALAPFEKPEATKLWADAALRLAVRGAEARRRSVPSDAPDRAGFVATIVRASDAIFEREGGVATALAANAPDFKNLAPIARIALEARVELLGTSSDADVGKRGLSIAEALLASSPRDAALLRAAAVCAETAGDYGRAADHLRALVGGLPPRTDPWFAAKVDQIRVLAKLDPGRARAVLSQYRTLYPDLGPEPIRNRILEIERTLPADGAAPNGGGST
ncbi:MAG: hypothetical protein RLY21_301 [Planctomycetota bacterium]